MKRISSSAFTQRPINGSVFPRIPMTEWEYLEKHVGERPRSIYDSDSDTDFDQNSDKYSTGGASDTHILSSSYTTTYSEENIIEDDPMQWDPRQLGKALKTKLSSLSEMYERADKRISEREILTKKAISNQIYPYLHDIDEPEPVIELRSIPIIEKEDPVHTHPLPEAPLSAPFLDQHRLDPASQKAKDIAQRTSEWRHCKDVRDNDTDSSESEPEEVTLRLKPKTRSFDKRIDKAQVAERTAQLRQMKTRRYDPVGSESSFLKTVSQPKPATSVVQVPDSAPVPEEPLETEDVSAPRAEVVYIGPTDITEITKIARENPPPMSDEVYNRLNRSSRKQAQPREPHRPGRPICNEHVDRSEREKRMFSDPPQTKSAVLRNQTIKQKMALKQAKEDDLVRDSKRRVQRERDAYARIQPDLQRIAQVSHERQKQAQKFTGIADDPRAVGAIEQVLEEASYADTLLSRDAVKLAPIESLNREWKEEIAEEKRREIAATQWRKEINDRLYASWRP